MLKVLPKSYFRNYIRIRFSIISSCIFFSVCSITFAEPFAYNERSTYFDQLEERARLLSNKLDAFARSDFNANDKFKDNSVGRLTGFADADINASFVEISDGNSSAPFLPKSEEVEEDDLSEEITMENQIGRYYIQPFIGMSVPPHQISFKGLPHSAEIKTEIGHAVGINMGRRWKNFEAEIHYGYINTEFKKTIFPFPYSSPQHTSGQSELFVGGARLGYGVPFGEGGWFRFASGVGFANRKDVLNLDYLGKITPYFGSETVFTYDFLFSLGYEVKKDLDVFIAYRALATSGKGDFQDATMHLLELGLGANF